jgi:lipid-A-disaccharide synthase-like uncharacterized protein
MQNYVWNLSSNRFLFSNQWFGYWCCIEHLKSKGTHLPAAFCAMGLFGDRPMYDNGHVYLALISFGPMFGF